MPRITKRQKLAVAQLLYGDAGGFEYDQEGGPDGRPTQKQIAKRYGVSQSAISQRVARFVKGLTDDERVHYLQCKGPNKPRHPKKKKLGQLREELI